MFSCLISSDTLRCSYPYDGLPDRSYLVLWASSTLVIYHISIVCDSRLPSAWSKRFMESVAIVVSWDSCWSLSDRSHCTIIPTFKYPAFESSPEPEHNSDQGVEWLFNGYEYASLIYQVGCSDWQARITLWAILEDDPDCTHLLPICRTSISRLDIAAPMNLPGHTLHALIYITLPCG